jgi:NAD(P)-dependent dehydrogenase (short-subunit alcohol dehydrogenase family)
MCGAKSEPKSMKQPVILITGASQGIGAAIAKVFANELLGCRLALVARSEKNLRSTAKACLKLGANAEIFPGDVSVEADVEAIARAVGSHFGTVDVLINNAGVFRAAPFAETSVKDFDELIAANLRSVFLMSRAFVPAMAKRGRGDVFNMSSIAGLGAYPNSAAYCAAKFGVTGLSKVLREELREKGVRVCCVHPGATWSPSWSSSGVKAERIMPPEDVARAFFDVYRLGRRTVVEEIVLRPQLGDL